MSSKQQKKVNFHFVTGNPLSESEKRNVRTIVRSNASNRRWRLVREAADKSKSKGEIRDGFLSSPSESSVVDNDINEDPPDNEVANVERQERLYKAAGKHSRRQNRVAVRGIRTYSGGPLKTTNISQNFFGAIPASDVSKQSITRMLHGTAAAYVQLFPPGKNIAISQMARDWFQQCFQTRGLLHTMVYCQAVRAQAARPGWDAMPTNELMLCQTEAVHAINDKLSQNDTACDDESVRIVFSLTWHGAAKRDRPKKSPKQSPMADLQALRLFMGIIDCDPVHAQGLLNMLKLRGGLSKVEMPGLEFLVSYADVLTASCFLTRPNWAHGSYAKYSADAVIDDNWLHCVHRADHPLRSLGTGFSLLYHWLPDAQASQLQGVFSDMADYIRASHDFVLGRLEDRNPALMADRRNSVQHSLMSLRPLDDYKSEVDDLFELCWLAGVGYSMIAVFPLAVNAARFDRVAYMMRDVLCRPSVLQHWSDGLSILMWVGAVGGLCAIGTNDRDWFIQFLKQQVDSAGIQTWFEMRCRLMEFLWLPLASDEDGDELWAEIEHKGRVTVWSSPDGD